MTPENSKLLCSILPYPEKPSLLFLTPSPPLCSLTHSDFAQEKLRLINMLTPEFWYKKCWSLLHHYQNVTYRAISLPIVSVYCRCRKIKYTFFFFCTGITCSTGYYHNHQLIKQPYFPARQAPFPRQAFPQTLSDTSTDTQAEIPSSTGSYFRFNKLVWRWQPTISSHINTRNLFLTLTSVHQDFLPVIRTREGKQSYRNNTRNLLLLFIQSINNGVAFHGRWCKPWS